MNLLIHGYKFVLGCFACPEQYDVFDTNDTQVAYLRLRHGKFTVECPDIGGDIVYMASPEGDGIFKPDERMQYLTTAAEKIQEWIIDQKYKNIQTES